MKIANWDKYYENAQSRKVHRLAWVPVPNKHDGERYSELMTRSDASEIFSAWILILQVGSRSQCRGSLLRDDGRPHTAESLAIKTRGNVEWFKKAIPYLSQIGWLEQVAEDATSTLPVDSQSSTISLPSCQARREGKGIEEKDSNNQETKKTRKTLSDQEFIKSLQEDPRLGHVNFDLENAKMDAWLKLHPGRQKTRKFVLNWYGRVEAPLNGLSSSLNKPRPSFEEYKAAEEAYSKEHSNGK